MGWAGSQIGLIIQSRNNFRIWQVRSLPYGIASRDPVQTLRRGRLAAGEPPSTRAQHQSLSEKSRVSFVAGQNFRKRGCAARVLFSSSELHRNAGARDTCGVTLATWCCRRAYRLRLLALSCSGAAPRCGLRSRTRGLRLHTHAHAVQIDCCACSLRAIDKTLPETVVSGPWWPARRRSPPGSKLKMECAFAHLPLDVHNVVDESDEISANSLIALSRATRRAKSRPASLTCWSGRSRELLPAKPCLFLAVTTS